MQTYNIDISQPRGPLVLYASQGDSLSRFFAVTVTDNGASYDPPAGAIYTVRFGAPGKPAGWYDTITEVGSGTHPAVVVSGNTYTVELAEQAVSVPGTNAVVLIVSDAAGYTLATWAFELQVAAVPGYDAPEATVYYNALSEQVAQVLSSATAAAASATLAESWAVGGTGTRTGEDTNNAEYWASEAQRVSQDALGWYETEQALQAAHPTGTNGQWAIIGSTDTIWTWDSDTSAWVNSGAVGGLSTYTCATSSTTHALTGAGDNIKFVADAAYNEGDTITVNGTAVTAQTQDGAALATGAWAAGAVVVCWLNGTTLNFKGGGGRVTVSGLSADKILQGTTVTVKQGAKTVASVSGTIPSKTAATYTPAAADQTIAAGQYLSGAQTIAGSPNLAAGNIRAGVNIFGVVGALIPVDSYSTNGKTSAAGTVIAQYTVKYTGWYVVAAIAVADPQNYYPNREIYVQKNGTGRIGQRALHTAFAVHHYACNVGDVLSLYYQDGQEGYNGIEYSFYVARLG